jgi:hypothetical protein
MIGIDPASICPLPYEVDVPDKEARFAAVAADWIEDRFGAADFSWQSHWHYAPRELLARAYSHEELIWLWHGCIFSSDLDRHVEEHEALVWKVRHALWRYGGSTDFQQFVECHNGLGRLSVDLPGFGVRVSHTRSINTAAWADHGRDNPIYLDASFGALVHYRGEHVMTVGFAPSAYGICVAQVQLRQNRGNRFLYKLPAPYLDFALDLLQRAFPRDALYLVTGASTTAAIRAAYGKGAGKLSAETCGRVERFYDQAIAGYTRTGETIRCGSDDGRVFARLAHAGSAIPAVKEAA